MNKKLILIYHKLYNFFGPQKWWPAKSPFEVMVGAVLTQGTNWSNVEKAIKNLKEGKLLNPLKIHHLSCEKLGCLLKPAGYYNIKARRLKNLVSFLVKHYSARLNQLCEKDTFVLRQELLAINGVGPETADSILLYALNKPIFVVDNYTKRVLLRHKLIPKNASYDGIQKFFMQNLKKDVKLFNEYHALLVKLAKEFCLKNKPRCFHCPLKNLK